MKPTQFTFIIIAVVVVMAGVFFAMNNQRKSDSGKTNQVGTAGTYCGSNGDLVETMPIQSHRSYCVSTTATVLNLNQPTEVAFQIVDDQGAILTDYDLVHEKIMHVILVRKDLTNFQHLHPDFDAETGLFTLNDVTVAAEGPYRIFADFTPTGSQLGPDGAKLPVVDHVDVVAGSLTAYQPVELGNANSSDTTRSYNVSLAVSPSLLEADQTATLAFTITENGNKITNLEKYLGELGHAVVLKDGDLRFLHTHPMDQDIGQQNGTVAFEVVFPEPGRYKAFMQFQHRGAVQTVEFILPDVTGAAAETEPIEGGMFH